MDWQSFKSGDLVWFDPNNSGFHIPGEIQEVHVAAQVLIVGAFIDGKLQTFTYGPEEGHIFMRMDAYKDGVDDLTQLNDLHEASILWNLRLRYEQSQVYTYIGSILISINPYQHHPELYGLEMAKRHSMSVLGQLPPHLFAIGQAAYSSLISRRQNQAIIVSGESGSGKTESTKLIMQYLAAIVPRSGMSSHKITEQILEASPLLESFGNAKTSMNDNSSRFGKYLEVYFKNGAIIGAKIIPYLLEKSRIVTQNTDERNYHIFYELLGGLSESERTKYGLLEADKYFYLNQGCTDCTPNGSCKEWSSLQSSLHVLGFSELERESIIKVLGAVLHLGNVYFHRKQLRNSMEGVELGSEGAECKWAGHLLGISYEDLIRSLRSKITETRAELVETPLNIDQALDARDAFAKALYHGLFNWIVSKINSMIHKGGTHDASRMSLLDIFGFESLEENSFEQLCINYANENLQLYFNKHIFKLEQAEYAKEKLEWNNLQWEDNLPVIHLLAKKPVGIFHLLDDESNFPRASDVSFLEKCHYNHALSEHYSRPRIGAQEFGIKHYAGEVWYQVDGFLEKNRDLLRPEVLELIASSSIDLVQDIARHLKAQRERSLPRGSNGRFITMKPRAPTVSARFSESLQQLLTTMSKANPWFIRCIKPNHDKQARKLDMPCLMNQLRYLGILSTVKIRKQGYPVRLRFQHFVERYRHLLRQPIPRGAPYRDLARMILESLPSRADFEYQIGSTRVFLRESLHRVLEMERSNRLHRAATTIQRNVRTILMKRRKSRQEVSALIIQRAFRGYRERKRYQIVKKGFTRLQATYRARKIRRRHEKIKNELKRRKHSEKMEKEILHRVEREQRLEKMNSIVHLDVPAELAFIFSKLDNWNQIHGDRSLVKVVGTIPGPPLVPELPMGLDQFAFGKFSSVYCDGIQLHPRKDPITQPFLSRTSTKDKDFHDALTIFKLILRWCAEQMDSIKDKIFADYIVNKALTSRSLRDEILVQLCNQVYGAEERQATRIWQLISHCLSSFAPGAAFSKYLIKFVVDNAPEVQKELILKKILRSNNQVSRLYPPTYLEWRASKQSDVALGLTLPDGSYQIVAIDSWTNCEEAASLSLANQAGFNTQGWSVSFDDGFAITDTCGLDYVLDLVAEKELCPAFPSQKNDLLRTKRRNAAMDKSMNMSSGSYDIEPSSPKRPIVPPPAPPTQRNSINSSAKVEEKRLEYKKNSIAPPPAAQRKTSIDLLSRNSALNERYFEIEKSRSRSMDDLLNSDSESVPAITVAPPEPPRNDLGLSESRLNDRYHSQERLNPPMMKAPMHPSSRLAKPQFKKVVPGNRYMERNDMPFRAGYANSEASETLSLASHVRRVRVPSQASDVDQFLDDLFSPVLDGNLDELSDARSLAASIRGTDARFEELLNDVDIENYIDEVFDPIVMSGNVSSLGETDHLVKAIKGGDPFNGGNSKAKERSFIESAMEQNIRIQKQLMAQNEALQTLLTSQGKLADNQNGVKMFDSREVMMKSRRDSIDNENRSIPPPPPPMPPPLDESDPFQRPFLDPYGRAKTVRIGKWRWPPPNPENAEDAFMAFKMRQNQRKTTPQHQSTPDRNGDDSRNSAEWEDYDLEHSNSNNQHHHHHHQPPPAEEKSRERFKSEPALNKLQQPAANRQPKRSFDIGAERIALPSIGKLKLSSEMRQRLEQVTAGHSVRSSTSNKSEMQGERQIMKLDEAKKMMLEQQLTGINSMSVRETIMKMEESKKAQKPFMPLPSVPAPPPPIRPPNSAHITASASSSQPPQQNKEKIPRFLQRMDNDTFGVKDNFNDSWGRAEAEKLNMMYDMDKRSRSQSREREHFSESVWDRTEVEGPPSSDEAYRTSMREKNRRLEMSQIQRETESQKAYRPKSPPKVVNKKKESAQSNASSTATFKNHMYSQKERERKESLLSNNQPMRMDELDMIADEFSSPPAPKPVLAPDILKSPAACLTYNARLSWKLKVRKEVFRPHENLSSPTEVDLIFAQIINDIIGSSIRLSEHEKRQAQHFLKTNGIDIDNLGGQQQQIRNMVKRKLIELARSNWPLYFARLFIVSGSPQYPEVAILAVNQHGVYLARREDETIIIKTKIMLDDLDAAITLPRPGALQLNLRNGNRFVLHATRASAIATFIQSFLNEFRQLQSKPASISSGVKAAAATLNVPIEKFEITNGISSSPTEQHHQQHQQQQQQQQLMKRVEPHNVEHAFNQNGYASRKSSTPLQEQNGGSIMHLHEDSSTINQTSIVKHSLLQFALQHFRNDSPEAYQKSRSSEERSLEERFNANLVKWQSYPLKHPLLKLPQDLNALALECFECILRYCGDMPQDREFTEVKCVYTILMHCHKHVILRDEVYCQLMKQTTANRSTCSDSLQRAWRLLSILAAYFSCSDALKAYLVEHLTSAASDRRGTAAVCLANLRKTARCGGRKNVPSVEEVTAVSAGRSARRQIYRLPGGAERVVNTRCSTVVADVIAELCALLGIDSEFEQQEFSLYCIVQGDAFTMPLSSDEYILDVTTELLKTNQPFYLIFCRSVWHFPLKREPVPLYIEVLFNQVAPDYLEGLLLELPNHMGAPKSEYIKDISRIAAILHRAADLNHMPVMKEIKFLLPKPALALREIKPAQWVNYVQAEFLKVSPLSPLQCKAQFLSILSKWPLFGSSFFAVKRVFGDDIGAVPDDDSSAVYRELILALNYRGVLFLDSNTHDTLHHWNFIEIISTRKVRSDDALFLDIKVGNLLQQNVIRVQTEQAHEISRIMKQYITMAQKTGQRE